MECDIKILTVSETHPDFSRLVRCRIRRSKVFRNIFHFNIAAQLHRNFLLFRLCIISREYLLSNLSICLGELADFLLVLPHVQTEKQRVFRVPEDAGKLLIEYHSERVTVCLSCIRLVYTFTRNACYHCT